MKVGSLFSGIGGIDLGFSLAGHTVVWAVEKDAACCRTYRYNFPDVPIIKDDIRLVDAAKLPLVDIIAAGFPCQAFSVAGKQRGFHDPRGNLFYEVGRFIKEIRPRFVFLENVSNLVEHDGGRTFNVVHNVLSELDYSIRYGIFRASEYGGVPQIRDRIYIVAFREQIDCDSFSFPLPVQLNLSIQEVLKRDEQKHQVYYYDEKQDFYRKIKGIVTKKDSIYRVYHESIKPVKNHMCPTLTATMGTQPNQVPLIVDDYGIRKLTLRECLDFQGFPKEFYFPNTISINDAYKQIGNSVCVPVIKRIAERIGALLN